MTIFYCLRSETPPTCRARSPYLYPPGTGWSSYTPRALGSLFVASYDSQSYGGIRNRLHTGRLQLVVTLRLAVYRQSVRLCDRPLRLTTSNFFQQNICGHSPYVISSRTRGWVCRLQLLLVLASAVFSWSESHGTHDHILLTQIWDCLKLEGQVFLFLSSRNRLSQLYPQALGSLSSPPATRRAMVEVFDPASTRESWQYPESSWVLYHDRRSFGHSILE
jgi:hypothetical protein